MPVSNELLEYQRVDGELRRIELEIASSEERKKFVQAKKFMEAAREKLEAQDKRAVELHRLRDDLAARVEEITRAIAEYSELEEMLEEGADIAFYKKNAQALLDRLRVVKAELNKLIAEINAASEEYKKFKEQTIAMQKQYKEYSEKFKELKNSRAAEVKAITEKMQELAKKIEPRILEVYQTKRKEKIFPVVVPLNGEFCMCGRDFPLAQQGSLAGGNMVECENCHRLVYKL